MEHCKTCRFVLAGANDSNGHCRRYPPAVMLVKIGVDATGRVCNSPLQKAAQITEIPQAMFPLMALETGWCGEYAPAPQIVN